MPESEIVGYVLRGEPYCRDEKGYNQVRARAGAGDGGLDSRAQNEILDARRLDRIADGPGHGLAYFGDPVAQRHHRHVPDGRAGRFLL
ncbi:MAG: hypothetical protein ACRD44_12190 [Bryobacteraceae bacterium]